MMKKKDLSLPHSHLQPDLEKHSALFSSPGSFPYRSRESAGFSKIRVPGSKSISNRALLLASLAEGVSFLKGVLFSEDTHGMMQVCRLLGVGIEQTGPDSLRIEGLGGRFKATAQELYVGNAGTCARFLCAALLRGQGSYILRGDPRMHERPMKELIDALRLWGAEIQCLETEGCLPVRIVAQDELEGSKLCIRADRSSQFLSALLMLAPFTRRGAEIEVQGDFVSSTYAEMTLSMMQDFGVELTKPSLVSFSIPGTQTYKARSFEIPGDASSASYFFALAAISGRKICVENLENRPVQSDRGFIELLEQMGAKIGGEGAELWVEGRPETLRGLCVDMKDRSDVVPSLAIVALFAKGRTDIQHVAHMREKECDRIHALCVELRKLGARVMEHADGLSIEAPLQWFKEVRIHTYNDHRIAMAFSILATQIPGIEIENPDCVAKTYPGFYEDLRSLGF